MEFYRTVTGMEQGKAFLGFKEIRPSRNYYLGPKKKKNFFSWSLRRPSPHRRAAIQERDEKMISRLSQIMRYFKELVCPSFLF